MNITVTIFCPYSASFLIDAPAPHLVGRLWPRASSELRTSSFSELSMKTSSLSQHYSIHGCFSLNSASFLLDGPAPPLGRLSSELRTSTSPGLAAPAASSPDSGARLLPESRPERWSATGYPRGARALSAPRPGSGSLSSSSTCVSSPSPTPRRSRP